MKMINEEMIASRVRFSDSGKGEIGISGFPQDIASKLFAVFAYGGHYLKNGIADGSLLLCYYTKDIKDGDLVIKMVKDVPTIYLYRKDKEINEKGEARITHSLRGVRIKVLASLNLY